MINLKNERIFPHTLRGGHDAKSPDSRLGGAEDRHGLSPDETFVQIASRAALPGLGNVRGVNAHRLKMVFAPEASRVTAAAER